ncbi:MAG TPA: cytochrome c oxidase assembly protein [Burkholderiaceae bacterium]|jgi:cytochrome c oxidase assembly protein subunit 11|nr:cytochrome c oxidase assembly protein [Burkholderiaceae bacterium]
MQAPANPKANGALLRKLLIIAVVMFGFGWALIPIYRKICEITGINLLTDPDPRAAERVRNTQVDTSRTVVIEFDANKQGPWRFKPRVNHLKVHPGELVRVDYDLVNLESRALAGQAIPSYAPQQAARYFNKLECFCFKQQTLAAGETRQFPVVFFVAPDLPADVTQITLSYTFFEVPGAAPAVAPAAPRS